MITDKKVYAIAFHCVLVEGTGADLEVFQLVIFLVSKTQLALVVGQHLIQSSFNPFTRQILPSLQLHILPANRHQQQLC